MISTTEQVRSADQTLIAYDRQGQGAPVIMVGGGLDDGSENAPLAAELAGAHTVINYSRRGRGRSTDTAPYALQREIEDLAALAAVAEGPVHLFGASSGGALALEAAAAGLAVDKIAVYEVPYAIGEPAVAAWQDYAAEIGAIVADGRPDDALARFMRLAGMPDEAIEAARTSPEFAASSALAHTLPYDAACLGDGPPPQRLSKIDKPTLVITGDAGLEFFGPAAAAITELLPQAESRLLPSQGHVADPGALAAMLQEFFDAA
ncbi:alpha/beta fold hydrolase [Microlunatus speluncae]|uniref:alpha/beta fold hydrolase n=1 Tax=Microlunatus speluncae TaxID=2594267 RepID=UPI001266636C|nr:alpha/beta hydrolase [Microlunatus speluncae]